MSKINPECSPINYLCYDTMIEQVLDVFALIQNFLTFIFSLIQTHPDVQES